MNTVVVPVTLAQLQLLRLPIAFYFSNKGQAAGGGFLSLDWHFCSPWESMLSCSSKSTPRTSINFVQGRLL